MTRLPRYEPAEIERRWQRAWRAAGVFDVPEPSDGRADAYVFAACPFTSGHAHIGHARSYTIADAIARYRRARGERVLFSLGFDAFGLPAEMAAVKIGRSPQRWVRECVDRMREQFERLGYSFDWSREFVTSDEDMYRWTQWLFLRLYELGLVYQSPGQVDWCDGCETVLARLQVVDGACWRCHGPVRQRNIVQWYLRVSAYHEELAARLDDSLRGWNRAARGAQRSVLGRTEGVEVRAELPGGRTIEAFTPHATRLSEAAFVAISPKFPGVLDLISDRAVAARVANMRLRAQEREERGIDRIPVLQTGVAARVAGLERPLPVLVVWGDDQRYGDGATLGVPGADATDAAIAARMGIEHPAPAEGAVTGQPAVRYASRDFAISRQRAWGTPIPLVHCPACGVVPVPADQLPVRLPEIVPTGAGGQLGECAEFRSCACPRCGGTAERDLETLDCHMDGLWFWIAPCVPPADRATALFDHPEVRRWLPIDVVVWGADGGGYMHDIRMVTKSLRDSGELAFIDDGEPYVGVLMHEMVHSDGRKMSKHLGNVVDPIDVAEVYGADTLRLAIASVSPEKAFSWSEDRLIAANRLIAEVWAFADRHPELDLSGVVGTVAATTERDALLAYLEWTSDRAAAAYERGAVHLAVRDAEALLRRLVSWCAANPPAGDPDDAAVASAGLAALLRVLAPLAPHVAEELWSRLGGPGLLAATPWRPATVQAVGGVHHTEVATVQMTS